MVEDDLRKNLKYLDENVPQWCLSNCCLSSHEVEPGAAQ
jgi:hypothetical protein